ncbi:MAG TPA: flagellar biosynthesis protein FlgB [Myxococcales bacterium]|nr:flagellar biosynthesis protein FlgB [Myxococcales bacterium]
MKVFDPTLAVLERSLDVRLSKQNALAADLANADTPGFKPLDVDFDKAMKAAVQDLDEPAAPAPATETAGSVEAGLDGNGVDRDKTLVSLASNALQYGASARAAGKKLAILRYVATDGNG